MKLKILLLLVISLFTTIVFAQVPNAPVVQINSGNPKFPFPRFQEYNSGKTLALYNPEGVVHAEMEQDIRDAYQIMMNRARVETQTLGGTPYVSFNNFVQHADLRGGYGTFVTEGDGYALIAAAYMADKKTFDGLWMWCHDYRLTHVKRYIDCTNMRNTYYFGKYAELWNVYTTGASNEDRATDGTVDYAIALLMAYRQWGEHSGIIDACGNEINYKTEALNFINSMVEPFLNTDRADAMKYYMMGVVGLDGYMKSGNKWTELTTWAQGTLQTIMTGIGVPMTGTGVDPAGLSANVHWINGQTVTRDFFDYHASAYFKEYGDFLQEVYDEGNPAYVTTLFNIAQCRRAEASTDWLMQKAMEQNLIPYIGGISNCANDGSSVTFHNVGEGEDFRLPMRTITNYIWHGTPNYKWDPAAHKVVAGTQTSELTAANKLCTFLKAPGNNCETLGMDPTGTKIKYTGVSVLRQAYNMTGAAIDSYYTNYTLGSSAPAPIATGDTKLAAKMYRQSIIEWDVEESLAEVIADPTKRYLKSTPKYFHGYYRMFPLLMLTGNYIAPTKAAPVANLKCYVDIDKTYGPKGDIVTYTASYRNYASVAATGTQLVFTVPNEVQFISCQGGGVYNAATKTITWNIGTVPGFVTGGLAATKGQFDIIVKVTASTGRFCPASTISCTNGTGWTSNLYPNNITATMERNCYDIVAKALEITKTSTLNQVNPDMGLEYTVSFKNNAAAGYLDGGRPGTRATFAEGYSDAPTSSREQQLYFRLYHAAEEPYINYANYRLSYYAKSDTRGITPALGADGWFIKSWIAEGGPLDTKWDEIILPFGNPVQNSVNQRIIIGFPYNLAAPAAHLYNQTGNDHRIHKGVNFPLKLSASITDGHSVNQNFTDDWSYSPTVNLGSQTLDKEIFFPVTPDWTDPVNFPAGQAVNTWHTEECRTTATTFDKVLIEEFDGYGWRRIFGTSPLPGRPATDVVMVDTIPTQFTFVAFTQTASFGKTELITSGGRSIVKWSNSSFLPGQDVTIKYTVKAKSETALGGCPLNINTENISYIYSVGEAAQSDTAIVNITCDVIVIPPAVTSMTKTSDKTTYAVNDNIVYTIDYKQTMGANSKPDLNTSTGWTTRYSRPMPTFGGGKITFNNQNYGFITNNYAHGKNGEFKVNFTRTNVSESFTFFMRYDPTSTNVPGVAGFKGISVSIVPSSDWQGLGLVTYDGATKLTPIYGAEDKLPVSVTTMDMSFVIRNDSLIVWLNKDTYLTPTVIYKVTTLTPGYAGIFGGKNGGNSYVSGTINSWNSHFDSAFNLEIDDAIPATTTYVSSSNSGINTAGRVAWPITAGPVLYNTPFQYTLTVKLTSCPATGKIINNAYANAYGFKVDSIGAQNTANCGAAPCPSAPTVTPTYTYCKGATAPALTATGTALKWYTVATGGTSSGTAPTPITTTAGTTSYWVTQTTGGCESPRAKIDVTIVETANPTVTTPVTICKNNIAVQLTATGTALKWYNSTLTLLAAAPTPITTTVGSTDYYVTQTLNTCESDKEKITVTIIETLAPTVTSPVNYCQNATATALTATGTALKWYTVATGGTSSGTAPTPITTTVGTTNYYVSQTVSTCESPRALIAVTINAKPDATITPNKTSYCGTTSDVTLALTPASGVLTGATYKWMRGGSAIAGATSATLTTGVTAGSYTCEITLQGCISITPALVISQYDKPEYTITGNGSYCPESSTKTPVVITFTKGTAPFTFDEAVTGTGKTSATATYTINNPVAGTYKPTNIVDVNGCTGVTNTASVTVSDNPTPSLTIATLPNSCNGVSTTVNIASFVTAAAGTIAYSTNKGTINASGVLTLAGVGIYTITVELTATTGGCKNTKTATLEVWDNPTVSISSASTSTCYNQALQLTATATGGSGVFTGAGAGYSWTDASNVLSSKLIANPTITATPATTQIYPLTVQATDNRGCKGTNTTNITVYAQITTPTVTSTPVCAGTGLVVTTPVVAGATYAWTTPDGFAPGNVNTFTRAASTTAMSGTYSVIVTANGCSSTAGSGTATVNALPAAPAAPSPITYCLNSAASPLTATALPGYTLQWYTVATGGTASTTAPTPITTAAGSTTYYVSQKLTAAPNCEGPRTPITVTINNSLSPTINANPGISVCQGTAINLSASGGTFTSYTWSGTAAAQLGGGTTIATPTFSASTLAGTYTLTVNVADANGCSGTSTQTITVHPIPTVTITANPTSIYPNTTSLITATPSSTGGTGLWSGTFGNVTEMTETTATVSSPTTGTTTISYVYTSSPANGSCTSNPVTTTVTIIALPPAPTVAPISYCLNAVATPLTATGSNLLWYTAATGGTGSATAPTPVTTAVGTFHYYVSQTISGGESARADLVVTVNSNLSPVIAASSITECAGTAINLSITGGPFTTQTWSGTAAAQLGGGTTIATPTFSAAAPAGTYTATVNVTDANGCTGTDTKMITIKAIPATPTVTSTPVCAGSGLTITTPVVAGATYAWTGPVAYAPGNVNTSTRAAATVAMSGTYTVTTTVLGCMSAVGSGTAIVNANPIITVTPSRVDACKTGNNSTAITVSTTGTVAGGTFVYSSVPAGVNASNGTLDPATAAVGSYLITLNYSDLNGCAGTAGATAEIHAIPTPSFVVPPATKCIYDPSFTLNTLPAVVAPATGTFSGAVTTSTFNPATATIGANNITYTYRDQYGCENTTSTSINVIQIAPPTVTSGNPKSLVVKVDDTFNAGDNTNLTATGANTIQWMDATCSTVNGTGGTYATGKTPLDLGSFTYKVRQTDAVSGCSSICTDAIITLTKCQALTPSAINPYYCVGEATPLTATATTNGTQGAGDKLSWFANSDKTGFINDGLTYTSALSTASSGTETIYVAQWNNTDACYSAVKAVTINVVANPSVTLTADADVCSAAGLVNIAVTPNTGILTATGVGAAGLNAAARTWDPNNGGAPAPTKAVNFSYLVTETQPDGHTCSTTKTASTTAHFMASPTPQNKTWLIGDIANIPSGHMTAATSGAGVSIKWYKEAAMTNLLASAPFSAGTLVADRAALQTEVGSNTTYTKPYWITQTDATGCESLPVQVDLILVNCPWTPPTVVGTEKCLNVALPNITAAKPVAMTEAVDNWNWYNVSSGGTALYTASNSFAHAVSNAVAGTTTFYVSYTATETLSTKQCESPRTPVTVIVDPLPTVTIDETKPVLCYDQGAELIESTTTSTNGAGTATWTVDGLAPGITSGGVFDPTFKGMVTGTYVLGLSYTDGKGCVKATTKSIDVQYSPAPTTTGHLSLMSQNIAAQVTAAGLPTATFNWYAALTGGASIGSGTPWLTGDPGNVEVASPGKNYYASQTVRGCESQRTAANVIIPNCPFLPPTVVGTEKCQGVALPNITAAKPVAMTEAVDEWHWFTVPTGGTAANTATGTYAHGVSNAAAGATTFYVSYEATETISGVACESPRTPVTVIVDPLPTVTIDETKTVLCYDQGAELIEKTTTSANGAGTSTWTVDGLAAGITSGGIFDPTFKGMVTDTYVLGLSYTDAKGCVKAATKSIDVQYSPAPTTTGHLSLITQNLDAEVTASGLPTATFTWYQNAIGGTSMGTGTPWLTGDPGNTAIPSPGINYYASQTVRGCESQRTAANVIITNCPFTAPTVVGTEKCLNETLPNITAAKPVTMTETVDEWEWYDVPTGGTALYTASNSYAHGVSNAIDGTTNFYVSYKATETVSGEQCESPRTLVTVRVNKLPSVNFMTAPNFVCYDGGATIFTPVLNYYTNGPGSSSWDINGSSLGITNGVLDPTFNGKVSGTYPIKFTYTDGKGCVNSITHFTSVRYSPIPTPIGYLALKSATATVEISVSNLETTPSVGTVEWFTTSGTSVSTANPFNTTGINPNQEISTYFNAKQVIQGCYSEAVQVPVQIIDCPVPSPAVSAIAPTCIYSTTPEIQASIGSPWLQGTRPTQTNPVEFRYYSQATGGTPLTTNTTGLYTPTLPNKQNGGTYDFWVAEYNPNVVPQGCESILRTKVTIQVNKTDAINIIGEKDVCERPQEQNPKLQAIGIVSSGIVEWYESRPTIPASTVANSMGEFYNPSFTSVGSHKVYAVQKLNGCLSEIDSISFSIKPIPAAPITIPNETCFGTPNTALKATGSAINWYQNADKSGVKLATNNASYTPGSNIATANTYTYYASQNINGCESSTAPVVYTIKSNPDKPTIITNATSCAADLEHSISVAVEPNTEIRWYTSADTSTLLTIGNVYLHQIMNTAGVKTYYARKFNNNCLSDVSSKSFTIVQTPSAPVVSDMSVCKNSKATITTDDADNMWYTNNTATDFISKGKTYTIDNVTANTTFYIVKKKFGCSSSTEDVTISVVDPTISIAGPGNKTLLEKCVNEANQDITAVISPAVSGTDYVEWKINPGNSTVRKNDFINLDSYITTADIQTDITYKIIAKYYKTLPTGSCNSTTDTVIYVVHKRAHTPIVIESTICQGTAIEPIRAIGSPKMEWVSKNSLPSSFGNVYDFAKLGIKEIAVGTYVFELTDKSLDNCDSKTATVTLEVAPAADAKIIGDSTVCINTKEEFYTIETNATQPSSYGWEISGNQLNYTKEQSFTNMRYVDWDKPGIDTIILRERTYAGCDGIDTMIVNIADYPIAYFTYTMPGAANEIWFTDSTTQNPIQEMAPNGEMKTIPIEYTMYWNFGEIINGDQTDEVVEYKDRKHVVEAEGFTYGLKYPELTVINEYGCESKYNDEIYIDVKAGIYIPTAFSPTNPAYGVRFFQPVGYNIASCEVWVYDAWGNLVWYSNKVENGIFVEKWDGTYKGELLKSDTYIWKMEAKLMDGKDWEGTHQANGKYSKFGSVVLIR